MLKSIKIKLYPSKVQEKYINNLLGTSRFVYNKCLEYRINKYNQNKETVSFTKLGLYLTSLKNEFHWIRESHSKVLQQSLINLDTAYKSFFKNGNGFPNFKSKKSKQSCRFPVDAISGIKGNRINEKILNKNQDKIKSGTLTKTKTGEYYFSILIDIKFEKELKNTKEIIGIDLGIKDFIVDSNNNHYENIKIRRNNEKKLKILQRNLSKKQKGSKNREKARIKLAKFHKILNNKKEYYLHSIVNQLLNDNQVIVIEDLNIKGMLKNHCLAKSIQELSLYRFKEILKYKSNWYNRDIIEVDRFFPSSKLCNHCGHKNEDLSLNDRTWKCPKCNSMLERDYNAALNIKKEGVKILNIGMSLPDFKPLEKSH